MSIKQPWESMSPSQCEERALAHETVGEWKESATWWMYAGYVTTGRARSERYATAETRAWLKAANV